MEPTRKPDVRLERWGEMWTNSINPHHYRAHVHKLLLSYFSNMSQCSGNLRVFVPLCGKSLDLKWLADQGHYVTGVEAIERPVRDFFENQVSRYTTESSSTGVIYKSSDEHIVVYVSDLFQLSRDELGTFDLIWDRASFVALDRRHQSRYISLMTSLMTRGCRYLLSAVDMKKASGETTTGPPHVTTKSDLEELFGYSYTVTFLEGLNCTADADPVWNIEWFYENLYLIKQKINGKENFL